MLGMSRLDESLAILEALALPRGQLNERSALTLLALARVGPEDPWTAVRRPPLRIFDIMAFMSEIYGKTYAPNSRETIRRQTIHQFEQARLVDRNADDASRPTNSGKTVYTLTAEAAEVLKRFGTAGFDAAVAGFAEDYGRLAAAYDQAREMGRVPLSLPDGSVVMLSAGEHNVLQAAVIAEFGPRFAPAATVLYIGDTARKHVVFEAYELARIGVPINQHDKLPDILLYDRARNWLFLIEAVTSHGPVSPKRHREIEATLTECSAARVYVTAFLTSAEFRKYAADIAWETEV